MWFLILEFEVFFDFRVVPYRGRGDDADIFVRQTEKRFQEIYFPSAFERMQPDAFLQQIKTELFYFSSE